jgi:hypothetical protein
MTRSETFSKIKTPEVVKAFHQARDRARQHGWLLQTRLNLDHAAARGRATGVIVLLDGKILGGDTHFYYTGSYTWGESVARHLDDVALDRKIGSICPGVLGDQQDVTIGVRALQSPQITWAFWPTA